VHLALGHNRQLAHSNNQSLLNLWYGKRLLSVKRGTLDDHADDERVCARMNLRSHETLSHECDDVACEAFSSRVAEGVVYYSFYSSIEEEEFIEDRDIRSQQ
jgi:hypothetical protein